MRVLVIEDNLDIQANIADFLENDFTLEFAYSGEQGLALALEYDFDVIVLDIMLPGLSGIEVCRRYRESAATSAPILMLTARDTLHDKEIGFLAGADDYMVKPFALKELAWRLNALARRPRTKNSNVLRYQGMELLAGNRSFKYNEKTYSLHDKEAELLSILMRAAPDIVRTSTLEFGLWGEDAPESGALRTHIYNLRKALQKTDGLSLSIISHRGRGYSLEPTA